jgi:hypothetical protein
MEVHRLEREFLYNGVKLLDNTPAMNRTFALLSQSQLCRSLAVAAAVRLHSQKGSQKSKER